MPTSSLTQKDFVCVQTQCQFARPRISCPYCKRFQIACRNDNSAFAARRRTDGRLLSVSSRLVTQRRQTAARPASNLTGRCCPYRSTNRLIWGRSAGALFCLSRWMIVSIMMRKFWPVLLHCLLGSSRLCGSAAMLMSCYMLKSAVDRWAEKRKRHPTHFNSQTLFVVPFVLCNEGRG
ncbi:hypothetical protein BC567DRAFT_60419 [Phyllosticta citribraziliensis]